MTARERELVRQAKRGDQRALERLLAMHRGFIVRLARQYDTRGVEFDDVLQEAELGFIAGVRKIPARCPRDPPRRGRPRDAAPAHPGRPTTGPPRREQAPPALSRE